MPLYSYLTRRPGAAGWQPTVAVDPDELASFGIEIELPRSAAA